MTMGPLELLEGCGLFTIVAICCSPPIVLEKDGYNNTYDYYQNNDVGKTGDCKNTQDRKNPNDKEN